MKKHGKRDANHDEIVRALRQLPNVSVFETHEFGGGFPDIVCGVQNGSVRRNVFMEIKSAQSARMTPMEELFAQTWRGQYDVVTSVDEALNLVTARRIPQTG